MVLAGIHSDAQFADAISKFSEDGSRERGGDIGSVGRGRLALAFENALFALKVGERSAVGRERVRFSHHRASRPTHPDWGRAKLRAPCRRHMPMHCQSWQSRKQETHHDDESSKRVMGALLWTGLAHAQADATTAHELDARLLNKLHEANQLEIAAGKLAQAQTPTPGVKKFGAKLIADHSASDAEVSAIAKAEGVDLVPAAETPLDALRDLKGAKFDRAFALLMVKDHTSAIQALQAAHDDPHGAQVRALIAKTLPVVQKHLKHAQQLENPLPHT